MKNSNRHNAAARLLLLGMLLPGANLANADAFPPSGLSLPAAASLHLSENLSIGMSHAQSPFPADMAQGPHGGSSLSNVAKAYLDYTFLSRRTGNLHQNLQGRFEIANKSDFPLGDTARFRVDNTGLGAYDNRYLRDGADYRADSGFLASLEWRLDAPGFADRPAFDDLTWGEVLQISFFADYGRTFSDSRTPDSAFDDSISSAKLLERGFSGPGIGTGLSFSLPGRLTANLRAAYPLYSWEPDGTGAHGEQMGSDSSRARYWFDFSYNF